MPLDPTPVSVPMWLWDEITSTLESDCFIYQSQGAAETLYRIRRHFDGAGDEPIPKETSHETPLR